MSNLGQLRGRVRQYLDEITPFYWTDIEINEWINQSYFYYYMWVLQSYDSYFAKDTLINIVASQPKYPMPSDLFKIRLLERVYATFTVPLRYFERMETANIIANTNFSNLYLPTYRFEGNNIVLEPTPDVSITNGLRLEYIPEPIKMVLDTDTPDADYSKMWEEPIVLRAAISAKQKEEAVANTGTDMASLSALLQNYEQTIKETAQERTTARKYTEPFGLDDGERYYP